MKKKKGKEKLDKEKMKEIIKKAVNDPNLQKEIKEHQKKYGTMEDRKFTT